MKKALLPVPVVLLCAFLFACGCFNFRGSKQSSPLDFQYFLHTSVPAEWETPINQAGFSWTVASVDGIRFVNVLPGQRFPFVANLPSDNTNAIWRANFLSLLPNNPRRGQILGLARPFFNGCEVREQDMLISVDFLPGHELNRGFHPPEPLVQAPAGCPSQSPFPANCRQIFDLQSLALHEFGHFLVLDHVSFPMSAVMFPSQGPAQTKRFPTVCDAAGAACIYQQPFGKCQLCRPFNPLLCPFALMNQQPTVATLQQFRDTKMLATAQGTDYVSDFNRYAMEVADMVVRDSLLRSDAVSAVESFAPYLSGYMAQTDLRFVVFSQAMYSQASAVIDRALVGATPELASELQAFRSQLQAQVGKTFQAAVDSLLGVNPPPPPPPPDDPPPDPDPPPGDETPPMIYLTDESVNEIDVILGLDESTRQRLDAFLESKASMIKDWATGGSQAQGLTFVQQDFAELASIVDQMKLLASSQLVADLDRVKTYLSARVGVSYGAILEENLSPQIQ